MTGARRSAGHDLGCRGLDQRAHPQGPQAACEALSPARVSSGSVIRSVMRVSGGG